MLAVCPPGLSPNARMTVVAARSRTTLTHLGCPGRNGFVSIAAPLATPLAAPLAALFGEPALAALSTSRRALSSSWRVAAGAAFTGTTETAHAVVPATAGPW